MSTIVEVGASGLKYEDVVYRFIDGMYRDYKKSLASEDYKDHAFAHAVQLISWFTDELLIGKAPGFAAYPFNNSDQEQQDYYEGIHNSIRKILAVADAIGQGSVLLQDVTQDKLRGDLVSKVDLSDHERMSRFAIGQSAIEPIVFLENNLKVPFGTLSGFGCQYQPTGSVFYMRDVQNSPMAHVSIPLI
jgi:hypothetical protein